MTTDYSPNTSPDPDQQRREIAATREDMGRTMAEIEDRVSPSRIKERQSARMRSKWTRMRESVMGTSEEAKSRTSAKAHEAQERMQEAPERVEAMTRGNPMAAGLIALGFGALAGSLLPASRPEQEMASELRDEFEAPVRQGLQRTGHEMQDQLKEQAKETVKEHAMEVMSDTKESAKRTQEEAKTSAQEVGSEAKDAGQSVRKQS